KLQTALMIDGRDLSRKNHLINGVYVARAGNFHGARSYEKIGNSGKRFLFYSATKQGWKISDKLQDLQSFAYARVEDRGQTAPSELGDQLSWKVFDGKEVGYAKDKDVLCSRVNTAELLKAAQVAIKEHKAASGTARADTAKVSPAVAPDRRLQLAAAARGGGAGQPAGRAAVQAVAIAGEVISSSSSGSDSEEFPDEEPKVPQKSAPSKSERERAPAKEPARKKPAPPTPKPVVAAARRVVVVTTLKSATGFRPGANEVAATPKPISKGKVCAKMLVRSGLRCTCCFRLRQDCEKLKTA
ncbi:unnamed protein product, partial [Polarella glacialis]